jgi:hypothetical protein
VPHVRRAAQGARLTKALLYCDNAAVHRNKLGLSILAEGNVRLVGLIPSCTAWMQPLDVGLFGRLKAKLPSVARDVDKIITEDNLAFLVEETVKELVSMDTKKGKSIGASGFAKSGLSPFNVEVFDDESFKATDTL